MWLIIVAISVLNPFVFGAEVRFERQCFRDTPSFARRLD